MTSWDELSNEEGAKVLGCTTNVFATRLHRARRRLADQLELIKLDDPLAAKRQGVQDERP